MVDDRKIYEEEGLIIGLLIDRFCLTGGKSPIGYLKAYLTNLYLSADSCYSSECGEFRCPCPEDPPPLGSRDR